MQEDLCREMILSEEYSDFILSENIEDYFTYQTRNGIGTTDGIEYCIQPVGYQMAVLHVKRDKIMKELFRQPRYREIPKLYTFMDTISVEATGAVRLQEQPVLRLTGKGVMIGIIDTGIDYLHPCFDDEFGTTRIIRIWDQTIQTGVAPKGFYYGSEYTKEEIDLAKKSDHPYEIVPSKDTQGHGTFLAGIAAARADLKEGMIGAAPESFIVMVKVKPAKEYLKQFFYVDNDAYVCQESDLLLGVRYVYEVSRQMSLPLIILLGVGSSMGAHDGSGFLAKQLRNVGEMEGVVIVTPTGNEGDQRHHVRGNLLDKEFAEVELKVGEKQNGSSKTEGLTIELWGRQPDLLTVGFVSPTGSTIERIPAYSGTTAELSFVFETSKLYVDYWPIEGISGDELILMRLKTPMEGIWRIRVYGENLIYGIYDMWISSNQVLGREAYFLESDPSITVTDPGTSTNVITVGGYQARNLSYYVSSGRGYNRDGGIVPDFVAPAVDVTGPISRNRYGIKSGTSAAAALTAGVCAQVVEYFLKKQGSFYGITTETVKNFLIKGAERDEHEVYPNPRLGYGRLNVYHSFEQLLKG